MHTPSTAFADTPANSAAALAPTRPARYFPAQGGRYEVKVGLHALGTDFGNGPLDAQLCQFDRQFADYRAAKLAARAERLDKYHPRLAEAAALERRAGRWLADTLARERPELFGLEQTPDGGLQLDCRLTGERLRLDAAGELTHCQRSEGGSADTLRPDYAGVLDAVAMQAQEDVAVLAPDARGIFRLAALHLCLPNHWAAEDKIGGDFTALHAPVPHMDHINRGADTVLARIAGGAGPYVRFAWGIATDARLNHHPRTPEYADPAEWQGRRFDPARPEAWLRVERQVLTGLGRESDGAAVLFTIRTYHYPLAEIAADPSRRAALRSALGSMSPAALTYKGLAEDRDALLAWLGDAPRARTD